MSFSDTQLSINHFYPKYDYSDYEEVQQDEGSKSQGYFEETTDGNSGLSHRLHPSLRSSESDSYFDRYNPSPVKKGGLSASDIHSYTPTILSGYDNELQLHLNGLSSPKPKGGKFSPEPLDSSPVTEHSVNDFYATLNSDTAAMLW